MLRRPGGELSRRSLEVVWIVDRSSLMVSGGKSVCLDRAMRQAFAAMRDIAARHPSVDVVTHTARFGRGADWETAQPVPIERAHWSDLDPDPMLPNKGSATLVILIDVSGSMVEEFDAAKAACAALCDQLLRRGADVQVGLVGFGIGGCHDRRRSRKYRVQELSQYTLGIWPVSAAGELTARLDQLTPGLFGGLGCYLADAETAEIFPHIVGLFGSDEGTQRILLVISDELGNCDALDDIVGQLQAARVITHVVGVPRRGGAHRELAHRTGGRFWHIRSDPGSEGYEDGIAFAAKAIASEVLRLLQGAQPPADLGAALSLVSAGLSAPSGCCLPPLLILIAAAPSTDDAAPALHRLLQHPMGRYARRIAVSMSEDADTELLTQFAEPGTRPLRAYGCSALNNQIRWISTAALQCACAPPSRPHGGAEPSAFPEPPVDVTRLEADSAW